MKNCLRAGGGLAGVVALGLLPGLAAGLTWEAELKSASGEVQTLRVAAAEKKFKITRPEGLQYLVRLDRNEMYFLDPKRRTYQVMSLTDVERTAATVERQMRAALSKMKGEIESLSPEQRALVEQMIGNSENSSATTQAQVRKTGVQKTIAGFRCEEYVVEIAGKPHLKACTTREVPAFEAMREDWVQLERKMDRWMPFGTGRRADLYRKIPGFPLETEMGGLHAVIKKVENTTPPPSEFEVPAGFERRPGPALPNME